MPKMKIGDGEFNYFLDNFTDPWLQSDVIFMHHGYCRNSRFWNSWIPSLARMYKILRFDVRGCGESSIPSERFPWSAEQLAQDALGLLDGLKIQRVHWVGESSGGVVGVVFAASYPDRVKSLVVCDSPANFGDRLLSNYAGDREDPAAGIEKLGFREWCIQTMGLRIDKSKADPRLVDWYASEMAKTPEHVAKALFRVFGAADIPKQSIPCSVRNFRRFRTWCPFANSRSLPRSGSQIFAENRGIGIRANGMNQGNERFAAYDSWT